MSRFDFWSAEAEPEGSGGRFALAGKHGSLQRGRREACSPRPPCSPPLRPLDTGCWGTPRRPGRGSLHQPPGGRGGGPRERRSVPRCPATGLRATGRRASARRLPVRLPASLGSGRAALRLPRPQVRLARGDCGSPAALPPSQRALPAARPRAAVKAGGDYAPPSPRQPPEGKGDGPAPSLGRPPALHSDRAEQLRCPSQ